MKKQEETYSESLKRLEQIISKIENNDLNLEDLTKQVEDAKAIIEHCKNKLKRVDEEIENLFDEKL